VDPKAETLYTMRLGQPENQYFASVNPLRKMKPTGCLRLRKRLTCQV